MKKLICLCDYCGHEAPSTGDGPAFVYAAHGRADLHGCSSAHLWLAVAGERAADRSHDMMPAEST